ncbi:hypothetical protein SASPL_123903 [Salvia splendens]|uniref:Uncharacterized protein n=1 Tax=Salvia splendens TaxID=180675 RepID=A0A8X8ZTM6_SALSN|nr:uncharacterized protein LOC121746033 [Salvia splendens]KAG6416473.1 hypothetical protein SASPL_123903 [Salvia splendens]
MEDPPPLPPILAPRGSGRRSCGDSNSPEFEFWMVRNPSLPPPNLLSADELFSGGVLLPLHHLNLSNEAESDASQSDRGPDPESSAVESAELSANSALTSSKRWRDIFRKNDKRIGEDRIIKERRGDKKSGSVSACSAELNINIWPFARSGSAGNASTRPRAPCSRSNSKSRKWAGSPGRGGVHLGRSRQVRRRVPVAGTSKARVLNFKVPVCMGYRQRFSCRSDAAGGKGLRGANLFNIRSLFTKKLY